jgi:hypothetical protein
MGEMVPGMGTVRRTWTTTVVNKAGQQVTLNWMAFANAQGRTMGGAVQLPDGTIRRFTYKRHIVLSSDPTVGQLKRAATRLHSKTKDLQVARRQIAEVAVAFKVRGARTQAPKAQPARRAQPAALAAWRAANRR